MMLYVHVPFCNGRCIYCGFYSTTMLELRDRYVDALTKEYSLRGDYLRGAPIRTIYVGGGTPSVLTQEQLRRLFSALPTRGEDIVEVTMECNPDDVTRELVEVVRECGVTRVSMGVQSFNNDMLRFLHRRHSAEDVSRAVDCLREGGVDNISIDLMFALPSQTLKDWHVDLERAVDLDVDHISAYSLTLEEGTPLYGMLRRGMVEETDEELSRWMYYDLIDMMEANGYAQYEISNFARKGRRAVHNSNYWKDVAYVGLGAAAHSYDHESRQWNAPDVETYVESIERGEVPFERELLTPTMRYNDMVLTRLRTREGIDLKGDFTNKDYLMGEAQKYIEKGWLVVADNHLRLTREALYTSDMVLADLVKVD